MKPIGATLAAAIILSGAAPMLRSGCPRQERTENNRSREAERRRKQDERCAKKAKQSRLGAV